MRTQTAHRRRIKRLKNGAFVDENSATTESDLEETFKRLVGEFGKSPTEIFDALKNQTVDLGFTAHPTQYVRRSLLQKHGRIRDCLAQLYAKDITPDVKQELDESLQREYGPVKQIDLKIPPRPPGYAFVEFEEARDAEDAIEGHDSYDFDGLSLLMVGVVVTHRRMSDLAIAMRGVVVSQNIEFRGKISFSSYLFFKIEIGGTNVSTGHHYDQWSNDYRLTKQCFLARYEGLKNFAFRMKYLGLLKMSTYQGITTRSESVAECQQYQDATAKYE